MRSALRLLLGGLAALLPLAPLSAASITDWHAACDGVTDDSIVLRTALQAVAGTGAAIHVPATCRLLLGPAARLGGGVAVLDGAGLVGEGGRDSADAQARYGTRGGTLLLADPDGPAMLAGRNWRLEHLIFDWPGQTGPEPRPMPPLLAALPGQEVSAGRFRDNDVVNAFVLMDFAAAVSGGLQIRDNRIWCLQACIRLRHMPLESWISGNQFTPNADWSAPGVGTGSSRRLMAQGASAAAVLEVSGDGTPGHSPSGSVDGLSLSDNTVFGMGYAVHVTGGWANLMTMEGNRFDAVPHVLAVEAGGRATGVTISGGLWYPYTLGDREAATAPVSASAAAAPGNALSVDNVSVPASSAGLVDWRAPDSDLSLSNLRAPVLNNGPGRAPAVRVDGTGSSLRAVALRIGDNAGAAPCIELHDAMRMVTVALSQFTGCRAVLSADAPPESALVTANQSLGTRGPSILEGIAAALPVRDNLWDRPPRP